MFNILIGLSVGFGMSSTISFLIYFFLKRQKIKEKQQEAQHIIQSTKDKQEQYKERAFNNIEDAKLHLIKKQNLYLEKIAVANRDLQAETEQQTDEKLNQLKKQKQDILKNVTTHLKINTQKEIHFKKIKTHFQEMQKQIISTLKQNFKIDIKDLKSQSQKKWIELTKNQILQQIKKKEEHLNHNVNQQAHFILDLALNRFQYPYCSERGIKAVTFNNIQSMKHILGSDFFIIKILEKQCGVDMKIHDQEPTISILGIDPVRRELGRACLQKIAQKNHIKKTDIPYLIEETKKELFRRIKIDGQKICQELNLSNVKLEIKNMMGALRYRYSFAQNQHFHCKEVGWLCGLLNLELGEPLLVARRAGMLHDIGKAMDHSKEGGHAVIGAEFIEKHGEQKSIVHAVKSHHHDTTPENPLDFLVISADAISGARPGARRSTVDSYNQKVLTLEKIGKSFPGVKDTYIMSAGREIRVIVDHYKINDKQALELSKKIVSKIEEECSYPGLIKVTVLRTMIQNINVQNKKIQS